MNQDLDIDEREQPVCLRYRIEYVLIRVLAAIISALPYRIALGVGWCVAALAWVVGRKRVHEAERRIRLVFGNRFTQRQVRRIAWISARNMVFGAIEMIQNFRLTPERVRGLYGDMAFMDDVINQRKTGGGGVIAVGHMGSWELAAVACFQHGIPIVTLAADQRNPLTNDYINWLRRRPGIVTFARKSGSMKEILVRVKRGDFLAILSDVRSRTPGIDVPFLGGRANIGTGMAALARHAGVPIFPVILSRVGWTKHVGRTANKPIVSNPTMDREGDIRHMTTEVLALYEAAIRENPEQWFWFNKRWILDPIESVECARG